jgi:hypothetical protein
MRGGIPESNGRFMGSMDVGGFVRQSDHGLETSRLEACTTNLAEA